MSKSGSSQAAPIPFAPSLSRLMNADSINIDYLSSLARVELSPEEKATYSRQLGQILEYFERLKSVNVDGVEPTAHAFPLENIYAEDKSREPLTPEAALQNAPSQREQQFAVPKVVEEA